ncbi:MAG TPA: adenylate/guanylate cyclase domain-containing protein [Gaiellaceae bacterium]|nr:adenylate/guanylate cyclase domain-containing protein [Gaiellaceae bacterium]
MEQSLTFLFTDIERSTALVRSLGADYCDVLASSRALLRAAAAEHGGREVECRADEFFAVFESPEAAVRAALAAQRSLLAQSWPDGAQVRVRMGLHTGSAIDAGYGLIGLDVHRAARVSSAGHGGQVLLTPATAELVDVPVLDLGCYELSGSRSRSTSTSSPSTASRRSSRRCAAPGAWTTGGCASSSPTTPRSCGAASPASSRTRA